MLSILNTNSTNLPLRSGIAALVYVDAPRNRRMNEDGASDDLTPQEFEDFTHSWFVEAIRLMSDVSTLIISTSYHTRYLIEKEIHYVALPMGLKYIQELVWYYNFGLYSREHFVNSHESYLILQRGKPRFHWQEIAVISERLKSRDPRGDQRGKTPDSVFRIYRVPGNSNERYFIEDFAGPRSCQPIELCELFLKAYTKHITDVVIDMFGGSGSMLKACQKLGRSCVYADISMKYCKEANRRLWDNWKRIQGIL